MTWCQHCAQNTDTHRDYSTGTICCVDCGKVVSQEVFTEDTQFVKDAAGGARMDGNIVRSATTSFADSHRRTLSKGNDIIYWLIEKYGINDVNHATQYYVIAVERGFTRGRRTAQVAGACLYVACREKEKPFLLIEFSSELGVSVYELGTVYLQLCQLLSLQNHPFVQRPVDPSLFMHRYTRELMKDGDNKNVLNTALHLAVSMKRDWIQTGRKPSGICAAAIYVSSVLHGYNFSKADVVKAVHICEATLTKRLIEFENTEAGSLTIEEFTQSALNYEEEMQSCKQSADDLKLPGMTDVVCEHKRSAVQSGFGLCKDCYMEFCGGLEGSEPPAFQRAQVERLSVIEGTQGNMKETENTVTSTEVERVALKSGKLDNSVDAVESSKEAVESSKEALADGNDTNDNNETDESDAFDDLDDSEITGYILDAEESSYKTKLWELINGKENMQERAAKEAAAKEAANKKDKIKRKREVEANIKPPQTAGEAASQHFSKKFGSKFNYEAMARLFDEEPIPKHRVDDQMVAEV
ncbi:putative transcription factor TFIIB, brf1, TBP-binding domain, cyclin, Cyclin-like superfamily [Helianthus annuus]|nr:putative transcription factor TFIIB, brf1, TBP-binding domain, cyclin, Cyclin-like superfamily [Helianthus annuus]KAJ0927941.1 putative transcription factor TFIIB, brf1, TBP-binding domain, cyclin, Cyclin-like superfamily [Helianthus annuus]KAJ0932349.1 putative transcription factor TFIIB, brf1, TBP-binding domain, Cyclin-like superfamily [Helianthus annuus]